LLTTSAPKVIQIGYLVCQKGTDVRELKITCRCKAVDAQSMNAERAFLKVLLGKSDGDVVSFGNGFEVVKVE
jgi:hypothetical protein